MKLIRYKLIVMALLMLPAVGTAKTVELNVESDRGIFGKSRTIHVNQ